MVVGQLRIVDLECSPVRPARRSGSHRNSRRIRQRSVPANAMVSRTPTQVQSCERASTSLQRAYLDLITTGDIYRLSNPAPLCYTTLSSSTTTLNVTQKATFDQGVDAGVNTAPERESFAYKSKKNYASVLRTDFEKKPQWLHDEYVREIPRNPVWEAVRRLFGFKKPKISRCSKASDSDLVYFLKMSSCFMPRTTNLACSLKNKAIRFLTEFDMGELTMKEAYTMLVNSVAEALVVDPLEVTFAKRIRDDKKNLDKMQPFFDQGRYRDVGLLLKM